MKKQTLVFCLIAATLSITRAKEETEQKQKRQFAAALLGIGSLFGELFAGAAAETAIGAGLGVAAGAGIAAGASAIHNHQHTAVDSAPSVVKPTSLTVGQTGTLTGVQTAVAAPPNPIPCEGTGFCTSGFCDPKNHLTVPNVFLCTGSRNCCIPTSICGGKRRVGQLEFKGPGECRLSGTDHVCHDDEEVSTVLTCNPGYTCCVDKNSTAAGIESGIHHHPHTALLVTPVVVKPTSLSVGQTGTMTGVQNQNPILCEDKGFCTSGICDLRNHLYVGNVLCTGSRNCCIPSGTCGVKRRVGQLEVKGPGECRLSGTDHVCHDDEKVSTVLTCNPGYTCCVDKN